MIEFQRPQGTIRIGKEIKTRYLYNKKRMQKSSVAIDIFLSKDKVPESISWHATDSSADIQQKAKAMCLAFWDGADKTAMRIDLWTKDMMTDEMGEFFYQMMYTMADTFSRATRNNELANELRDFSNSFIKKFREAEKKMSGE